MADEVFSNHPEFTHYLPTYLAINDFVNGSRAAVAKYLIPYATESASTKGGSAAFSTRLKRLYNKNLCEPPLVIHLGHLSQEIEVDGIGPGSALEAIAADMTGFGMKLENFYRELLYCYLHAGRVGVLIDGPAIVEKSRTGAIARGERSYCTMFKAHQIRDWEYFETGPMRGKFKRVVLQLAPVVDEKDRNKKYDRVYVMEANEQVETTTKIASYSVQWKILQDEESGALLDFVNGSMEAVPDSHSGERQFKIIDRGEIGLEEIPFVVIGDGVRDSVISGVWELNHATLNLNSTLTNIIYHQGFQRLLFAGVEEEEIRWLSENIGAITRNEKAQVFTIEAGNPDAAFREIAILENRARRTALFEHNQLMSEESKESPSAESKAMDTIARKKFYDYVLDLFEDKLAQVFRYIGMFEGEEDPTHAVTIEREYGLEDAAQAASEDGLAFSQAAQIGAIEVQKEILKRYIRKQNIDDELKKKLMANIDSATPAALGFSSFGGFGSPDQSTTTDTAPNPLI